MKRHLIRFALLGLLALGPVASSWAQTSLPAPQKLSQYVYVLRLVPRLHDDKAWTASDEAAVGRHAARIKALNAQGKVLFAGRALTDAAQTFGLVVLDYTTEAEARALMQQDDAVIAGVMTAELAPFGVFVERPQSAVSAQSNHP